MNANKRTAERWVKLAREEARRRMGTSAAMLTAEVQAAIVCSCLVGIIASQDDGTRNADTMVLACEMVMS